MKDFEKRVHFDIKVQKQECKIKFIPTYEKNLILIVTSLSLETVFYSEKYSM